MNTRVSRGIAGDIVVAMQALQQLPESLVISVLSECRQSLPEQLSFLPPALHVAAIHAAFPSIYAQRSLTLNSQVAGSAAVASVLPYIGNFTGLRTLIVLSLIHI